MDADCIALFTNGLYKVCSPQGDEFGRSALDSTFLRYKDLHSEKLCAAVLKDVSEFAGRSDFDDDVCIVTVETRQGVTSGSNQRPCPPEGPPPPCHRVVGIQAVATQHLTIHSASRALLRCHATASPCCATLPECMHASLYAARKPTVCTGYATNSCRSALGIVSPTDREAGIVPGPSLAARSLLGGRCPMQAPILDIPSRLGHSGTD